jgi:hypothetical protein
MNVKKKMSSIGIDVLKSSWRHTAVSSGEVFLALNITRYAGTLADMILSDGARLHMRYDQNKRMG